MTAWACLRPLTPDCDPILGRAAHLANFYNDCGWGGHGVKNAPAAGRALAELIAEGTAVSVDISGFSIDRFGTVETGRSAMKDETLNQDNVIPLGINNRDPKQLLLRASTDHEFESVLILGKTKTGMGVIILSEMSTAELSLMAAQLQKLVLESLVMD